MTDEQTIEATGRKSAGRPRRTDKPKSYNVYLPEDVAEWAKSQPDGLSAMVSSLLVREWEKSKRIAAAVAAIENEAG